jgi:hypothetical protein
MRSIQVSTDVFAAIWKVQQEGEQSENEILSRLLKLAPAKAPKNGKGGAGFRDPRYGVEFPEGFEIFRTYLGRDYRAQATAGCWLLLETGDMYPSLNALSCAIGAKTENAWINWLYIDPNGDRAPVSTLRDHAKIIRRRKRAGPTLTLSDLDL